MNSKWKYHIFVVGKLKKKNHYNTVKNYNGYLLNSCAYTVKVCIYRLRDGISINSCDKSLEGNKYKTKQK